MKRAFDLVVLGTGAAASTVAGQCREAGWDVAIVDSRPFGGTCALRGCDPKKVLVSAAEVVDRTGRMDGRGVRAEGLRIDWPELMRFKRSFTAPVPAAKERSFAESGIAAYHGRARFTGPSEVAAGEDALTARHIVIATGAAPSRLNIPGEDLAIHSDEFLELEQLPESIAFIGGGYIAFEFAHIALRAGVRVTILHRGKRPLERFDADLVRLLVKGTRELGADLRLETTVSGVEQAARGFRVLTPGESCEAELVVHAAGRAPEIDDLDLAAAGVERTREGITVNLFLQSVSNPAVYAAGDAAASGGPKLTPVAGYEGRIVASNLLEGNRQTPDYRGVASVVFTIPPLAAAGLSEETARRQKRRFTVHHQETSEWYSSRRTGENLSAFKVLVEEGSGRVLGAHILGEQAEELINVFALAIRAGLTADQLRETLYGYPTHGSNIRYML